MLFEIIWSVALIYIIAAVLPAVILLIYVYRKDKWEKEPPSLILQLLGCGVLAALIAMVLESIGESILNSKISSDNPYYVILLAFLIVAVAEEGAKFLLLKWRTWKNPNFNFRFDGIVYAVSVSLGFAAFENLEYVLGYGLSVAPMRALLAIPGHLSFAVYMGYFYGRAKMMDVRHYRPQSIFLQVCAWLSSVLLHGFYDTCAMSQTSQSTIIFVIFVILMFISVFLLIRRESTDDRPID